MARKKIEKDELLDRTEYLFRTRGYANTSIADIAQACGLSKASIYHHIASKEELAIKVIQRLHEQMQLVIFDIAYDSQLSATERAHAFVDAIHMFYQERVGGCLIASFIAETSETHAQIHSYCKKVFEAWLTAIVDLLSNKYSDAQAKLIAEDILAHVQGAVLLMQLNKNSALLARTMQSIKKQLCNERVENLSEPKDTQYIDETV